MTHLLTLLFCGWVLWFQVAPAPWKLFAVYETRAGCEQDQARMGSALHRYRAADGHLYITNTQEKYRCTPLGVRPSDFLPDVTAE